MSRLGRKAIELASGVECKNEGSVVAVVGSKGCLRVEIPPGVEITIGTTEMTVVPIGCSSAIHGLVRALLANAVCGVRVGFEKRLEVQGVGYQISLSASVVTLNVGFALPVRVTVPEGINCVSPDNTHLVISGCDRQKVGQFAATLRAVRPPEPFKGKGIRYQGEKVRRKAGKAFGAK